MISVFFHPYDGCNMNSCLIFTWLDTNNVDVDTVIITIILFQYSVLISTTVIFKFRGTHVYCRYVFIISTILNFQFVLIKRIDMFWCTLRYFTIRKNGSKKLY